MFAIRSAVAVVCAVLFFAACDRHGDDGGNNNNNNNGDGPTTPGTVRFTLGASDVAGPQPLTQAPRRGPALTADDEYIATPSKAKITFTSIEYWGVDKKLGTSELTDCTVVYDIAAGRGSTLLECPFTVPVGEISQLGLYFDKDLEIMISDDGVGIYTDASSSTGYVTTPPAGGATYVPYTINIGVGATRATPIVFVKPLVIEADSSPTMYITLDMIHTFQLRVNAGGSTLTAHPGNDPVAVFGGLAPGASHFYSTATTLGAYKIGGGGQALRIFTDAAGNPLFLMSPHCGIDGPKGAWASPPIGATVGGWLGKDSNGVIAWALPADTTYTTYASYLTMEAKTDLGQTTTLNCKASASPPPPADGLTYASGAPTITSPDMTANLTLIAK
jgi:hypothetical protein